MEGPLKNSRHEKFAVLVASGKTQADAYREVFPGSRKWKDSAVHVKGSELAGKVKGRISELQAKVADAAVVDRATALTVLSEILLKCPDDVTGKARFAQEMTIDPLTGKVTIRLPSKIAAFDALAKVFGWYAPQKVDGEFRFVPDGPVFDRLRQAAEGK